MRQPDRPRRDTGLTLIELVVVMVVIGLVLVSITVSFVALARTAPRNEARSDDSRSLLGMTTFLPEDVNSTPPNGFIFTQTVSAVDAGCLGATSENLVQMTWAEATTTYRSSYRYEPTGDGRAIVRYFCIEGSGGTESVSLTAELPNPFATVSVTPVTDSFGREVGLDLQVTTSDGKVLTVDARSNNPAVFLPPIVVGSYPPVPVGNTAPIAQPVYSNAEPGTARDVYLNGADADGDILTASASAVPAGWTVNVNDQIATVTPPASATPGTVASFDYTVVDPYGQAASSFVEVEVVATATNTAPTAAPVTGTATAGEPYVINLPVSDAEGDPLTVTHAGADPSLSVTVYRHSLVIESDGSQPDPPPFDYTVTDPGGLSATSTIDLDVVVCQVTSFTSSETDGVIERRNGNKRLVNDVTFTVGYTGPCTNLVMEYDHDLGPSGTDYDPIYLSFGSGTEVTVDGHPGGLTPWTLGTHTFTLRNGLTAPPLLTLNLEVVPQ
ncbi:MAG: prepilin-type N-terminal cleavage/methylation domain-containing protein [Ilumatobacter sp.]|nr:prepilin-type N-terminal cleavage/methylation domain-containing protein [Ilumatobacter sp.]